MMRANEKDIYKLIKVFLIKGRYLVVFIVNPSNILRLAQCFSTLA
jgi:hypothetical protein